MAGGVDDSSRKVRNFLNRTNRSIMIDSKVVRVH